MTSMTLLAGSSHEQLLRRGGQTLWRDDPDLGVLLDRELDYQNESLAMVAYASLADPSVLAAAGSVLSNLTAEGYPGQRYHPGTAVFDEIEELAVRRACEAFGARYANVQPHSCSSANLAVLFSLLEPGDTVLSLDLDAGGHLTHGSKASVTGRMFDVVRYGLDQDDRIDYHQVAELAMRHRPRVIIAGASAYPRQIDYQTFRSIADRVGAYLLADISHIAGLVATGRHPSPIDLAHVTTTSTYKQLAGPRGGLILIGAERDTPGPGGRTSMAALMQRAVFPRSQGTPNPAGIAAKARALALVQQPEFHAMTGRIVRDARALAATLRQAGYRILTGGTDNHTVLVDLRPERMSGVVAEHALQECGILANKNRLPQDDRSPLVTSGLRLGTNILAQRGMEASDAATCAGLVHRVLDATEADGDVNYQFPERVRAEVRGSVDALCRQFPVPSYQG